MVWCQGWRIWRDLLRGRPTWLGDRFHLKDVPVMFRISGHRVGHSDEGYASRDDGCFQRILRGDARSDHAASPLLLAGAPRKRFNRHSAVASSNCRISTICWATRLPEAERSPDRDMMIFLLEAQREREFGAASVVGIAGHLPLVNFATLEGICARLALDVSMRQIGNNVRM